MAECIQTISAWSSGVAARAKNAGRKIGNVFKNATPIGRMVTKGESFKEAAVGCCRAQKYYGKKLLKDYTPIGRMLSKGEGVSEAMVNSRTELFKSSSR